MVDLGKLSISVESEGVDEAAEKVQGATEGEGGGGLLSGVSGPGGGGGAATGGALGGLMGAITGLSTGMMAAVGALALIAGLLLSLKPIQKMIEATFKVIQAFLMPLAVMLMRLFMPVLGFLLRLLPAWYSFLSDPKGTIADAMAWLRGALMDMANHLVDLLPDWLTSPLGGDGESSGTFDSQNSIMNPERRRDIIDQGRDYSGGDDRGMQVNIMGGLEQFIERITTNESTTNFGPGPGP